MYGSVYVEHYTQTLTTLTGGVCPARATPPDINISIFNIFTLSIPEDELEVVKGSDVNVKYFQCWRPAVPDNSRRLWRLEKCSEDAACGGVG